MVKKGAPANAPNIVREFSGVRTKWERILPKIAQTAVRLSLRVVDAAGCIMNGTHLRVFLRSMRKELEGARCMVDILLRFDSHQFWNIFRVFTLKGAAVFIVEKDWNG